MEFQQTVTGIEPAPVVSIFASRVPSRSYLKILKPDVMTPGVYVVAGTTPRKPATHSDTIPVYGMYALESGTSEATL